MLRRTKFRVGVGSALALTLGAAAATAAYASPWDHGRGSGYSQTANRVTLSAANVATSTTASKMLASTIPSNGDLNPYGVAVVPEGMGKLVRGDVLVSNFNNKANMGGTGTSIIEVNPNTGGRIVFASLTRSSLPAACPGGLGLTTALVVLRDGWVVVGSTPTTDGTAATLHSGCLIVLNSRGEAKLVITGHGINGPWDMAAVDGGNAVELFVSNVLNGTASSMGMQVNKGTVVRIALAVSRQHFRILSAVTVASGLPEQTSMANLIQGPTGVAVIGSTLFIADTLGNRIAAIPHATTRHNSGGLGTTIAEAGLIQGPLGLTALPDGILLTANGNNGNLVAISQRGATALVKPLDTTAVAGSSAGAGALFGLAPSADGRRLFYVDDISNSLSILGPIQG
ncbi:MAG TPA: hypothetical protein VL551_19750 [Actinospica sp.]|jgi:hypothetical protein|nr:hypothetical protein [Actinospica sp.]